MLEVAHMGLHVAHMTGIEEMKKCLSKPRKNLSEHAPKMLMTTVPVDKIGMVIGPGGKNIKAICADYDCDLNVEEDGKCVVSGQDQAKLEEKKRQKEEKCCEGMK